jgi:hypothetical protein
MSGGGVPYPAPTAFLPVYNPLNYQLNTQILDLETAESIFYRKAGGVVSGLASFSQGLNSVGQVNITNTTNSTNRVSGALVVAGGLGVDLDTHMSNLHLTGANSECKISGANAYLNINNNTNASTSLTSGALRCAGGAYFGNSSSINGLTTNGNNIINLSGSSGNLSTPSGTFICNGIQDFRKGLCSTIMNFRVSTNQSNITGAGATYTTFSAGLTTEINISNSGSTFSSGVFTAGSDGNYYFSINLLFNNTTTAMNSANLVLNLNNGSSISTIWSGNLGALPAIGSGQVSINATQLVFLEVDDIVRFNMTILNGASNQVNLINPSRLMIIQIT